MKSLNVFAAVAIFASGVAFGLVTSNARTEAQQVQAEAPPPAQSKPLDPGNVGRYRISTFGTGASAWGCYRIDSQTGDTWLSMNGTKYKVVGN
jgi:hypothetical protein